MTAYVSTPRRTIAATIAAAQSLTRLPDDLVRLGGSTETSLPLRLIVQPDHIKPIEPRRGALAEKVSNGNMSQTIRPYSYAFDRSSRFTAISSCGPGNRSTGLALAAVRILH
jgi:hypothetical protein